MADSNCAMEKMQGQEKRKYGEGNGCPCIGVLREGPSNKVTLDSLL